MFSVKTVLFFYKCQIPEIVKNYIFTHKNIQKKNKTSLIAWDSNEVLIRNYNIYANEADKNSWYKVTENDWRQDASKK